MPATSAHRSALANILGALERHDAQVNEALDGILLAVRRGAGKDTVEERVEAVRALLTGNTATRQALRDMALHIADIGPGEVEPAAPAPVVAVETEVAPAVSARRAGRTGAAEGE